MFYCSTSGFCLVPVNSMTRFIRDLKSQTIAGVCLFNSRTSAGEVCKSIQLFTVHLLGGEKFSYQVDSCMSKRFRFNRELNFKLTASKEFLPNRNAFAFVTSLNIYCTSRRMISHASLREIFYCIILLTCITLRASYLVLVLQNQTVL